MSNIKKGSPLANEVKLPSQDKVARPTPHPAPGSAPRPTAKPQAQAPHQRDSFEDSSKGPRVLTGAHGKTVVDLGSGDNHATIHQTKQGGLTITSDGKTVKLTP